MSTHQTLMTEGSIWRVLLRFAFPLLLGNLFQQLYNAADSWTVGNFCGNDALAAVSSSGSLCYLLIGFFQGAFSGAGVVISRHYGAQDEAGVDRAVHTTVLLSLIAGIALSILGVVFTPAILTWMGTPDSVMPNSVLYFRIYCAGLLSLVLYNTANGIFQAMGDSRRPLYYLMLSSLVNVGLDLLFVAVFGWGVAGAAFATVLSQCLSAVLGFSYLMSRRSPVRIKLKQLRMDRLLAGQVLRLGLPSGVQNSVIAIANLVVQSNINAFGDHAMAGCGSYFKVEGFVFIPITSLTLAITTFVGQNMGAGKPDRLLRGSRLGLLMTVGCSEAVGVAVFFLAPVLISLFSPDPDVVAYGVRQARIQALFYCMPGISHGVAAVLRGAGRAMVPMMVMLSVWCVLRICYITVMMRFIPDITVVFTAYPLTWSISAVIFLVAYWKGDWLYRHLPSASQI